ncbi:conserved hypothetical protein [Leptospira interrogans serovar Manilae]|uniref:Uncharacterized protein n=1 Tax=Leptospira interrogans serovar Manilae TaxID=214675 RepID=A0AAQ1NZE0_LEPIR|nr:hypothetical protein [Leptospira interrogans]AKP26608.1 hypothetical protein LIMLP_12130 [Leptospira interrogans serovar Manilae]SOR62735.1 conserved hypothetical protein [Leptospira interrogans serovar Manilae]
MSLKTIKPIYYIKFLEYTIFKIPSKQSGRDRRGVNKLVKKKMSTFLHIFQFIDRSREPGFGETITKI